MQHGPAKPKSRKAFRRSYTAPIDGFQITSMHGYSAAELNAQMMGHTSGHDPMGPEPLSS